MAKNKNRKQAGTQSRSSQPEQAQDQSHRPASESHDSPMPQAQGSHADVARKKQKSFGHN
ncbi:hypothetical protein [Streptomyces sp. NPDC001635]|nr:hypothetical protein E4K10_11270 [Streptomyces sp. T1317-0309]